MKLPLYWTVIQIPIHLESENDTFCLAVNVQRNFLMSVAQISITSTHYTVIHSFMRKMKNNFFCFSFGRFFLVFVVARSSAFCKENNAEQDLNKYIY